MRDQQHKEQQAAKAAGHGGEARGATPDHRAKGTAGGPEDGGPTAPDAARPPAADTAAP